MAASAPPSNLPLNDTTAVRVVAYEHHLPGFIDAIQPDGTVVKGVNDGDRTGARVSLLWKPTEQLSITPRIVYQNLYDQRLPARRRLQHPRQSLHDDPARGHASASASSTPSSARASMMTSRSGI